jgi:cobalt-zinc-cadmium efflux system membrane fusion protein
MKTNIYLLIIVVTFFTSCNTKNVEKDNEHHHHEHGENGVINLNNKQQEALNLKIGDFKMRNLTTVVKINGQLEVSPKSRAEVTTLIGGTVKEINVFFGDKVKKGQVLAVLEHPDFISLQEAFAEVANNLEYLEQNYNRQKDLINANATSDKDYQKAKADYFTSKSRFEGLKSRLLLLNLSPQKVKQGEITNLISIISPINGYVNKINIKLGSFVSTKDVLFEIADNSDIHADFMVYENDVHLIKNGQKIHFTVSNQPEKEFTANIFAIGKEFEKNSRAVHIHSKINENTTGLIPGMYITGHIHTDGKYVKTLPNDAIVTEGTKSYIFIVDSNKTEHNHHSEEEHSEKSHLHEHNNLATLRLKMTEVITGTTDEGYTEIHLINELPENTKIALNSAYYLLSDLKKEETEHKH